MHTNHMVANQGRFVNMARRNEKPAVRAYNRLKEITYLFSMCLVVRQRPLRKYTPPTKKGVKLEIALPYQKP